MPVMIAVPNSPERNENTTNHQFSKCNRTCTIVLATVIPAVLISLILVIVYLAWGKAYLQRRRSGREEREAERRKIGDEESVTSSDVSTLNGEVLTTAEQRSDDVGRRDLRVDTGRERRAEERHEHDHVLAMIAARP